MLKYIDYDIVFQEIPNEVTLAINISNCPYRCKGCHSPQLQQNIGEDLTEDVLDKLISRYKDEITCVCFMGGDALPDDLEYLSCFIKKTSEGRLKTGWYSGRNKILKTSNIHNFDFIKLGAYIEHLGGLNSKITNQKLYKIKKDKMEDITHLMQKV